MIKSISIILLSAVVALPVANAAKLSPQQALARLQSGSMKLQYKSNLSELRLVEQLADNDIYIFGRDGAEGFVMVSGDDGVAPLLGYSDRGSFSLEEMPEQLKWLVGEYLGQIEYARQNNRTYADYGHISDVVEPMITSRWDQGEPFNNMCPSDRRGLCYTGCVATAMAQVANYWKYPAIGQGTFSYTRRACRFCQRHGSYGASC